MPIEHKDAPLEDYVGSRIVTSFPHVAAQFFAPHDEASSAAKGKPVSTKIKCVQIVDYIASQRGLLMTAGAFFDRYVSGSVEAACGLGLADAVVDLVETGTTMRAAGLCVKSVVMETEAVLIENPNNKFPELAATIVQRICGYIDSTKYQLINYNVSRHNLAQCVAITPGKKSPTILPLEEKDWLAVSAMVLKKEVPTILDQLTKAGASAILVFNLSNCRV